MVGARARYGQQVAGQPVPVALIVDGGGQAPGRARTRRTALGNGAVARAVEGGAVGPHAVGQPRPAHDADVGANSTRGMAQTPFLLRDDLVPSFPAQLTLGRAVPPPTCTLS